MRRILKASLKNASQDADSLGTNMFVTTLSLNHLYKKKGKFMNFNMLGPITDKLFILF